MTAPLNLQRTPPYYRAGFASLGVLAVVLALVWFQFHGDFLPTTQLTLLADRAGLSMDSGARVTYNGVQIGRVAKIEEITLNGEPKAKFTLAVNDKYIKLIPANVRAQIEASTAFGNKYVVFSTPASPAAEGISPRQMIVVSHVTTEFDTLFQTVLSITEKVDPVKVNATLSAIADALAGLGDKFGQSIVHGNAILDDLNAQMPRIRYDIQRFADLGDVYSAAAPDLFGALRNAVTTARTLNEQKSSLDAALMAAIGLGHTGAPTLERGGPYLVRGAKDLIPTSQLLDEYSPELFCFIRNANQIAPQTYKLLAGNGYAFLANIELLGAQNPYVYPDNLPRVNARGGPEGRPGCWQPITRDLWPAPYLVMDTGASVDPYNHLEIGTPWASEYVWGRQMGENTINP